MGHKFTCCRCLTFIKLLNSITCPGSGPLPVCRSRLQELLVHGPQRAGPRLPLAILETLPQPLAAGISTLSNSGFRGFKLIRQPEESASNESPQGSEQPPPGIACEPLANSWGCTQSVFFPQAPFPTFFYQGITAVTIAKPFCASIFALLPDMGFERQRQNCLMPAWPYEQYSYLLMMSACHTCSCTWLPSGEGTPEFVRRRRFLALCGWDTLAIRPNAPARSGNSPPASHGATRGDGTLDATSVALGCDMCGARAGMWDFVPRMVPPARPGTCLATAGVALAPHSPHATATSFI